MLYIHMLGRNTHSDFGLELRFATRNILSGFNGLPHLSVNRHPIGASKHSACSEESERIILCTSIVNRNVPQHVFIDLLREVDVDAEEVS